ncbi:hypothetical protein BDN70DRAFT_879279 [Pholiota conissans]|uniref:Uncharacterized protein n=1 Tax=Pholiota conissans TaxID=109636 RepID=A0A9P5Z2B5_9AGAR|nr:hypothetical protein BDN70DRAFT_879279 [Pholiota conissans]
MSSSPMAAAQARRRSQYKSPVGFKHDSTVARRLFSSDGVSKDDTDAHKSFLRDRIKAHCFERAAKARERAIYGKRKSSMYEPSSDDYPMDDDDEEDDEDIMQDELFRRIMANAKHKQNHAYKVSYAQEVGSSLDPDIEDVSRWEQQLAEIPSNSTNVFAASSSTSKAALYSFLEDDYENTIPDEILADLNLGGLADEELEAYAEECARRAALADFNDIASEELDERWNENEDSMPDGMNTS